MKKAGVAVIASLMVVIAPSVFALGEKTQAEALRLQESWRETIAHVPAPEAGACYHASYPSTTWNKISCTTAPDRPYTPRAQGVTYTVGNGNDYAAQSSTLISQTVGTFPTVTGVTSETDGSKNVYSIQLNSNFMTTAACKSISGCQSWQQFVYSSSEQSAFMQYWLINYGNKCPSSSWASYQGSCYMNSKAVSVPKIAITNLASLKMSGNAVNGGNDTLVFTYGTEAFSTSGKDTVVDLATGWRGSEFNIIGDGNASGATFNKGSSVTVKVALTNGSTAKPTCAANAGTTGETNNLTLGTCNAVGGSTPYIQFTQSN